MTSHFIFPDEMGQARLPDGGGKARNLWLLRRLRFEVPEFFVVGAGLFRELVLEDEEVVRLLLRYRKARRAGGEGADARRVRRELSGALETRVREIAFPDGFDGQLQEALARLGAGLDPDGPGVSVRSSAAVEDRPGRSFAGQFRSYLYLSGAERVREALVECWASAFGEGVLAYMELGGAGGLLEDVPVMAVAVQRMVEGSVSGVAFSVDPVEEDFDTVTITAGYGSCDGIVTDRVGTDQYRVGPGGEVRALVGEKTRRSVRSPYGGSATEDVGAGEAGSRALTDEQALELARLVRDAERLFGVAVDVEWTLAGGTFHLLQARPVTGLRAKDPRWKPKLLWDNSNIVESYSGVTSPLTFTFASTGYAVIYRQFGKLVGDSEAFLEAHKKELANMLGLQKGRVYYNLLNWYLALYYLPGFRFNKGAMESMMGVKESLDFQVPSGPMTPGEKLYELAAVVYMLGRIVWNSWRVDARVRDFHENFEAVYGAHASLDFERMQVPELLRMGERVRENLMLRWTAPILTDCLAMVFMKLLKNGCRDWIGGDRSGVENDLLAGEGDIDSTKPTKALVALAALIRAHPRAREIFETAGDRELRSAVAGLPELAFVREEIDRFREEFGFRCIGELKLEVDSIREDPSFVFAMLRNYVRQPQVDLGKMQERERTIRAGAEMYVAANLRGRGPVRALRGWLFGRILRGARKHVKNRENMRFARTRIFGFFRRVYDAVGLKLFAMGLLDHPKDVYYLTIEEVAAFVEGRAVTQDIRSLARLRFDEYERFRRESVPDRFSTQGIVYAPGNQRADAAKPGPAAPGLEQPQANGRFLTGVSCCPGIVRGKARVIRDASDDLTLNGEILVAPRTDPGWVPLFPSASGLLIESGSVLSHSAIVARELGIPAIVGVKGLVEHVRDGQELLMDGGKGTIDLSPEGPLPEPQAS